MEGGPPMFNPGSTSPSLIEGYDATPYYRTFTVFGHAFLRVRRFTSIRFRSPLLTESHIAFLSSGYLDVSVPRVCLAYLCIQYAIPLRVGFPIQISTDHSLVTSSL